MRAIIDRFEGPYAVCEKKDKTMINIKRLDLPKDAKEGCVLDIYENKIIVNESETKKRKEKIDFLTKNIWI
ncbi:MAG TPA: DUF3006 domain-containing protein [Clostridium sp.]|jgi:hypothetical protein|uniref:DUF3006 domain-containing protein n=1 Tax=Clostridium lapidicellarium TaxID=3240931 RepID=A0ABV4DUT7_9CLOT|nr:DUF3006 domain-containing protein [uncultured Clostridium sp.]NLU09151.1 DUF3006 domain-containing protein [Clostridiales bacterium]HBC97255.1 DUF3006 domain-containing protein [Clostridium sp.]